jgi:hypothetical protein
MYKSIIVPEATYNAILELAGNGSMQAVVAEAVEALRRRRILDGANSAFAALRRDPAAWSLELVERAEWDATIGDGQDDD